MGPDELKAVHDGFALLSRNQEAILGKFKKRRPIRTFIMGAIFGAALVLVYPFAVEFVGSVR